MKESRADYQRASRRALSGEEVRLWRKVADTTTPLSPQRDVSLKQEMAKLMDATAAPAGANDVSPESMDFKSALHPSAGSGKNMQTMSSKTNSGATNNRFLQSHTIEERIARSLSKGKVEIDARIDLHGMTQDRARFALLDFLQMAQRANHRIVLVITGKGNEGRGVLRNNVPKWLSLPGFQQLVNGFRESGGSHGGQGALYIRIRKLNAGQIR